MHRLLAMLLCLAILGCTSARKPLEPAGTPQEAGVAAILADLQRHADAIRSFEARRVTVAVQSPGLDARQQLPGSTLYYEKPGKLHVIGRKLAGKTYARITVAQGAFLLELPVDKAYYYRGPGQPFSEAAPEAAPGDVVEELFSPVNWRDISPAEVEVEWSSTEEGEDVARLLLPITADRFRRSVTAGFIGGSWVPLSAELAGPDGPLVQTQYDEYQVEDGSLFPMQMSIQFPREQAFLKFSIGVATLNTRIDQTLFDVEAQLDTLRHQRYQEREPYNPA